MTDDRPWIAACPVRARPDAAAHGLRFVADRPRRIGVVVLRFGPKRPYQSCAARSVSGSPLTSHASRPPRYQ
jgi:hypothetical protein